MVDWETPWLGYPKHARKGNARGNLRNGRSQKTVKGEQGHLDIDIPRDRQGTFEPQLVKKGHTRLEGFDATILALYARVMTTRAHTSAVTRARRGASVTYAAFEAVVSFMGVIILNAG